MLKFLKGRKRTRNAFLLFFVGVLTLSLVGLFSVVVSGGGAGLFGIAGGNDTTVAKVGGYEVTLKEYKDALSNFGQQIAQGQGRPRGQGIAETYAQFGPQVLDNLIAQRVILYEASRLSLGATDAELEARIMQTFSPWRGPDDYRARLRQANLTPVQFEQSLRASIAAEHLRSYITAVVQVSPQEVEEDYRRTNTKYSVRWVEVKPELLTDKVQVNDADVRAYFDSHKEDFKITTEQRRGRYIFIDPARAGESLQVSDDELRQEYDPERNVQQVRVSQIVINAPKAPPANFRAEPNSDAATKAQAEEDAVRKKAQDIADRARGAEGKPAEDFATLARETSEDAATKTNGGDLGWVNKNDKRESDNPLNNAFAMKQGDVSQPIKKGDKYYILKIFDRKLASFEESKPQLLKAARTRKGYTEAVNIAKDEADPRLKETKDANVVVAEINQKHGAMVASVREIPFFSSGETIPELRDVPEVEYAIFKLENPGDVSEHLPVSGGVAIPQYVEKRDPHDPSFEEVKPKAEQRYRADKAKELASERAQQVAKANSPDELKKIADSLGLKTDERAGISDTDSIGGLTTKESREPIYKLKAGEVLHTPLKAEGSDGFTIVSAVSRKDADMGETFQKEKKSIEQRLLDEKRNTYYATYMSQLQKQMKDDGKIKIYQDRIDSAIQAAASTQPGLEELPGMPGAGQQPPVRSGPRRTPQTGMPLPSR
ncbi:MAG TPA: SurA N-terminal domain-containing protein [Blastocatellia bacterium]|nr:SurA N-terminal domain-containing protein [Blastocatellia bacterium]